MELDIKSLTGKIEWECSHLIHSTDVVEYSGESQFIVALFEADRASINEIKEVYDVAVKEMEEHGFIMTSNMVQPTEMEGLEYWLEFVPRTKNAIIKYLNKKPMVNKIDNLEEKSLSELIQIIEQLNNK